MSGGLEGQRAQQCCLKGRHCNGSQRKRLMCWWKTWAICLRHRTERPCHAFCMYACSYVCMHVYVHKYVRMFVCMHMCASLILCTCMHACQFCRFCILRNKVYVCKYICTHVSVFLGPHSSARTTLAGKSVSLMCMYLWIFAYSSDVDMLAGMHVDIFVSHVICVAM